MASGRYKGNLPANALDRGAVGQEGRPADNGLPSFAE